MVNNTPDDTTGSKETALQKSIGEVAKSAEQTGFSKGAVAKTLEYIERAFQAKMLSKTGKSAEDPEAAKASLKQFAKIDFESLEDFARKYQLPATWEWIAPEAKLNYSQLTEFALATRTVPETQRYKLDPKVIGDMTLKVVGGEVRIVFNSIPGLGFSADKLLAACVSSRDKRSILYPHFNQNGNLVSTSVFETSPHQAYMIERTAREVLGKQGNLKKLYPDKLIKSRYGTTKVEQGIDSKVIVTHLESGQKFDTVDGMLDFPLGEYQTIDILYRDDKGNYAAYSHETKAMVVGSQFLDHLTHPEKFPNQEVGVEVIAKITGRHELNHAFWDNLSPERRKTIMDFFQTSNPNFNQFVSKILETDSYRNNAIADIQRDPKAEVLEINFKGTKIRVSKERLVNELIAYATWVEITDQTTMDKINAPGPDGKPKNPLMPLAAKCIDGLSQQQKQLLVGSLLKMEKDSTTFKSYFEPFILASKIMGARRKQP